MAHEARHAAIKDPAAYDTTTRLIHLLLAAVGVAALVSGQFAGDYRRPEHAGFDIHRWVGIAMTFALGLRFVWGLAGPSEVRFSSWFPVTRARLMAVREDLAALARLRIPERAGHGGLAGLVQAIGLLAFAWMAVSGAILFAYLETGARATGWARAVKELHEGAQPVVLAYIGLHVGAVIAHSFAGDPVWRRMLPRLRRDAGGS